MTWGEVYPGSGVEESDRPTRAVVGYSAFGPPISHSNASGSTFPTTSVCP